MWYFVAHDGSACLSGGSLTKSCLDCGCPQTCHSLGIIICFPPHSACLCLCHNSGL